MEDHLETGIQAGTADVDPATTIRAYLEAFGARDVSRCVDFFAGDARVKFMAAEYEGREAIEEWHRDRFDADLQVLKVDAIRAKGNQILVDAVVTSKKLRTWRIKSLSGRVTFLFDQGRIKETTFGLRAYNPFESW